MNYLIEWIANDVAPPHAPYIEVDQDPSNDGSYLRLDEFGNARGGIRNVWVDVPIATYGVFGVGKTVAQDRLCLLIGTEVPLAQETLDELYKNRGQYVSRINRRLMELVREGWFLPEYAGQVRDDLKVTDVP